MNHGINMTMYIVSWNGLPRHFLKKRGNMTLDHGVLKDEYIVIENISLCVSAPNKEIALSQGINYFCALDKNEDYLLSKNIDVIAQVLEKMNPTITELNDGTIYQLKEASSVIYKGFNIG
ncbi:hypothetical protein H012_gp894 [Acanthamoeba polyphaga moumouvirus]|uniref:Uncharacterized protein n=2 Tax=Moumouvirus TaxID=3080801 RepID=L7RBM9_9VIRU|nr:hypothetical protein H012_gp894 [Acanthamoeba polyphaga moumouvirus]AEX63305.1 hypothetical protein mv_L1103 [Moumouvirus Monve]AGC01572.1 hypothetical protein Moumou_00024 [Acanthamoeba polyphaga moumouvirus]